VASAGPYASLHLTPDRQQHQHPTTQFFTGRMPFLSPNQQRQSTEGTSNYFYQISTCQNMLFVGVTEKVVKTFVTTAINNNNNNKEICIVPQGAD